MNNVKILKMLKLKKKIFFKKYPDKKAAKGRTIHYLIRKLWPIVHSHKLSLNSHKSAQKFYEHLKIIFY